jgi:hypothetical protein
MELPEFKYCPFKQHLLRVFKLDAENNTSINEDDDYLNSQSKNLVFSYPGGPLNKINGNNNFMHSHDRVQKRRGSYVGTNIVVGRQYISFKKFCEIMKVFNYRTPTDVKIKCKYIFIYFSLF